MAAILLLNAALAALAWRLGTVTRAGAVGGAGVGAAVAVGLGWGGFALLAIFFALGSGATRMGSGSSEARSGRQALANGLPAAVCALWYGAFGGTAPLLGGFVAALATAAADTVSSEIGAAFGGAPRRLPDFRKAPAGTPGAVSFAGSAAGLVAALLVAGTAALVLPVPPSLVPLLAGAGFLAAFAEGLLAPLEARGWLDNDGVNLISGSGGALLGVGISL